MKTFLTLLCIFCVLTARLAVGLIDGEEERLIGWQGETFEPHRVAAAKNATQEVSLIVPNRPRTDPWIETICWSPRAFVYHNFLTMPEVDHLVTIGSMRVSRSLVVDAKTAASKLDDIRTSFGAAFGRGEDAIIAGIEEKISEWTHLPPENGEPIQILRYVDGQKYDAHWDWFDDPVHHEEYLRDGNRYATVLLYLSELEEGGETTLPLARFIDEAAQQLAHPSPCAARMGIALTPCKGDALLFYDMDIQGSAGVRASLHAACPALKGTKWTATKWIHNKRYMGGYDALAAAMQCRDLHAKCKERARAGGCERQGDMTGPGGVCRKTCKDCADCPAGDIICGRRNMAGLRGIQRRTSSGTVSKR